MTQKELKKELLYNPDTGIFIRLKTRTTAKKGSVAGSLHTLGYLHVSLKGEKSYALHRLAWLYEYGYLPDYPSEQIDHINHDKADNRIENLRLVNGKDNSKNASKRKDNSSGVTGVSFELVGKLKRVGRWKASISVDGKRINLGRFAEFSDAVNARKNAEVLYGYHENHGKEFSHG